jgi:hypothetical protein
MYGTNEFVVAGGLISYGAKSVAFSPDGTRIVSGGYAAVLR